jgi:hypothetical protein
MSENISAELYGREVKVAEHMADDTKFKTGDSVRVERKNDPNNKSIGIVSGTFHKMSNASIIYIVHFGHIMAGHDANYLESDLVKVTIGQGRRRKSRKSRKSRKARKTRRRHH